MSALWQRSDGLTPIVMPELLQPPDHSGSHGTENEPSAALIKSSKYAINELRGIAHELQSRLHELQCITQEAGITFNRLPIMLSMNKASYVLNKFSHVEASVHSFSEGIVAPSQEAYKGQQTGTAEKPQNGDKDTDLEANVDDNRTESKVSAFIVTLTSIDGAVQQMEHLLNDGIQAAVGNDTSKPQELTDENKANVATREELIADSKEQKPCDSASSLRPDAANVLPGLHASTPMAQDPLDSSPKSTNEAQHDVDVELIINGQVGATTMRNELAVNKPGDLPSSATETLGQHPADTVKMADDVTYPDDDSILLVRQAQHKTHLPSTIDGKLQDDEAKASADEVLAAVKDTVAESEKVESGTEKHDKREDVMEDSCEVVTGDTQGESSQEEHVEKDALTDTWPAYTIPEKEGCGLGHIFPWMNKVDTMNATEVDGIVFLDGTFTNIGRAVDHPELAPVETSVEDDSKSDHNVGDLAQIKESVDDHTSLSEEQIEKAAETPSTNDDSDDTILDEADVNLEKNSAIEDAPHVMTAEDEGDGLKHVFGLKDVETSESSHSENIEDEAQDGTFINSTPASEDTQPELQVMTMAVEADHDVTLSYPKFHAMTASESFEMTFNRKTSSFLTNKKDIQSRKSSGDSTLTELSPFTSPDSLQFPANSLAAKKDEEMEKTEVKEDRVVKKGKASKKRKASKKGKTSKQGNNKKDDGGATADGEDGVEDKGRTETGAGSENTSETTERGPASAKTEKRNALRRRAKAKAREQTAAKDDATDKKIEDAEGDTTVQE